MSLVASMLCVWCGLSRWCRLMDIGWVCNQCWEAAEGIDVRDAA